MLKLKTDLGVATKDKGIKGVKVIQKVVCILIIVMLLFGCSGRSPESDWTSEEYYHFAKEKYEDEDYFEAIREFTVVILRYAGSAVADSAQYYLAMSHYNLDEYIISAAEFNKLVNNMSESPLLQDAQYMLAESYYQMSPRAELDQEYTWRSQKEFQIFLEDFPRHEKREEVEKRIVELREKLAEKHWRNAELYRKMREFSSSIIYFDIVLNRYYDSDFADDAQYGKAVVYYDMEDYTKAKEELLIFKDKFSDSDIIAEVNETLQELIALESELSTNEE